jgi:aminopeptidase N
MSRLAASSLLLLAALLTFARPATAQSNAERMANDHYTRSHDYDIVHQRIELGAFDWDSLTFRGTVATTLVALRPGQDSIILDAGKLLQVDRVAGARGAALGYEHRGDSLVVRLATAARFRDTVRFTVTYRGRVENGRGLTFIESTPGREHRPRQLWSQGETDNNHLWFPTYDAPNDKMTWELVATVPRAFTAVSNGRLAADRAAPGGMRTMHWIQGKPASTYLVSLVVAPLVRIKDRWRTVPVDYFVYRSDSALARPLFDITPDMMEVYSRLTGVPYPWEKYAQTTVADFFGGMENVSATTLVDWLPDARAYADRPWYRHVLIPHELAHQWFGDLVTTGNWANMWLNEGFAEFLPGQYWGERLGRQAEDEYYLDEYGQFMSIDARRRMPLAALGSNNIYPRGALVLRMLQKHLGRERFWASVKLFLTRHAYGAAVTDDFRQAVLDATGENLDWFWSQWIYAAGYPELAVTTAYDSTARSLTLTIRQTQQDTAKADSTGLRYTTPEVFRLPLAIRIGTAAGDTVLATTLDAREQRVTVAGLRGAPTMVVVDNGNAILKTLDFAQPTAWLATQLERDPDLWNRDWVIDQLAKRPTDSLAAAALGRAARGADYFTTRAQAAAALRRFPATAAVPSLEAAARDTSALVRSAALGALGSFGGARVLEIARNAWERDPSYEVRATALAVVARLDPATRRTVITKGLATESYRGTIQNAALASAVQSGDSALVGAVEARLGDQPLAATALAVLAARKTPGAAQALVRHLDDERRWVREWVLEGLREGMEPAASLPLLRQAVDTLKHADTAAEARALISRLESGGPAGD